MLSSGSSSITPPFHHAQKLKLHTTGLWKQNVARTVGDTLLLEQETHSPGARDTLSRSQRAV